MDGDHGTSRLTWEITECKRDLPFGKRLAPCEWDSDGS